MGWYPPAVLAGNCDSPEAQGPLERAGGASGRGDPEFRAYKRDCRGKRLVSRVGTFATAPTVRMAGRSWRHREGIANSNSQERERGRHERGDGSSLAPSPLALS